MSDYITIGGTQLPKPPKFTPTREDIYKGDYTTCTGKRIADRVGWKYADMTLEWDGLEQDHVNVLIGMTGETSLVFDDLDGTAHTETVVRTSVVALRHRQTIGGKVWWKGVSVNISFIGSHTGAEPVTTSAD